MLLRLALVGMVAALGVTLPSQPKCESWFGAARTWASAALADWDTWKPREGDDDCVLGARGRADCPQCRLARARLAAEQRKPATSAEPAAAGHPVLLTEKPAVAPRETQPSRTESREPVAFEPYVPDEDLFARVAFELSRMTEGIAIPTASPVPTPTAPALPPIVDDSPLCFEPVAASDDLELSVLGELCRVTLETRTPVASEQVAAPEPRVVEPADDGSFVCGAGDGGQVLPTEFASSKPIPEITTGTTGGELLALSEPETDLDFCSGAACLLNRDFDDAPTLPPVATLADLPSDVFGPAPKTTLADLPPNVFGGSPGTAEAVSVAPGPALLAAPRVASGSQQLAAPRVASGPSRVVVLADLPSNVFGPPEPSPEPKVDRGFAGPRLGHAVELTRDALYAWMNVLTGPALVDVTSR